MGKEEIQIGSDGKKREYYETGNIKFITKYVNGEEKWREEYFETGNIKSEIFYSMKLTEENTYSEEGRLKEALTFFYDGSKGGVERTLFLKDGSLNSYEKSEENYSSSFDEKRYLATYHKNGNIESMKKWKHDDIHIERTYNDDQKLISETSHKFTYYDKNGKVVKNKLDAPTNDEGIIVQVPKHERTHTTYHDNGAVKSIENYESGEREAKYDLHLDIDFAIDIDETKHHEEMRRRAEYEERTGGPYIKMEYYNVKNGEQKEYYKNGNVKSIENYSFGEKNEKQTYFNEDGILKLKEHYYEDGKIRSKTNYKNGEKKDSIAYHESGNVKSIENYSFGGKNEKQTYFYENGNIKTEKDYIFGDCHNEIDYYKNGNISSETNLIDGKEYRENIIYREDGSIKSKGRYRNDYEKERIFYDKDGDTEFKKVSEGGDRDNTEEREEYTRYYKNGNLKSIENFVSGRTQDLKDRNYENGDCFGNDYYYFKQGKQKYFNEDGTLKSEENYKNGDLKNPKEYPVKNDHQRDETKDISYLKNMETKETILVEPKKIFQKIKSFFKKDIQLDKSNNSSNEDIKKTKLCPEAEKIVEPIEVKLDPKSIKVTKENKPKIIFPKSKSKANSLER